MEHIEVTCVRCGQTRHLIAKDRDYQRAKFDSSFQFVCPACQGSDVQKSIRALKLKNSSTVQVPSPVQ